MTCNRVREICGEVREALSIRSISRVVSDLTCKPRFIVDVRSCGEVFVDYQSAPVEKYVIRVWTPKKKIELRNTMLKTVHDSFGANAIIDYKFGFFVTTITIFGWS